MGCAKNNCLSIPLDHTLATLALCPSHPKVHCPLHQPLHAHIHVQWAGDGCCLIPPPLCVLFRLRQVLAGGCVRRWFAYLPLPPSSCFRDCCTPSRVLIPRPIKLGAQLRRAPLDIQRQTLHSPTRNPSPPQTRKLSHHPRPLPKPATAPLETRPFCRFFLGEKQGCTPKNGVSGQCEPCYNPPTQTGR